MSGKIRVAIIGVGNCASSLIQGVRFYRKADETANIPGLMHVNLDGYHIGDIEFSAAIDVVADKVGKDLSEAIWSGHNNTIKFSDVPYLGVPVMRGNTLDGLGTYLAQLISEAPGDPADLVRWLKETRADVVINMEPQGTHPTWNPFCRFISRPARYNRRDETNSPVPYFP